MYSPIKPGDFFNHPILNMVLYNNIGKKEYEKMKSYFKLPKINTSSYEDITSSFTDIFSSVPLTSYDVVNDDIRKYNFRKFKYFCHFLCSTTKRTPITIK